MNEIDVLLIAQTCHEVNRAFCIGHGDNSQPAWEEAPDWQKESAIAGVQYHLDNPNSEPCDSHNSWLDQKEKDGWVYGDIKSAALKEHPCIVPYEELPKFQQAKDALFISVVRSFE